MFYSGFAALQWSDVSAAEFQFVKIGPRGIRKIRKLYQKDFHYTHIFKLN